MPTRLHTYEPIPLLISGPKCG